MTTPSNGSSISWTQIQTEFGGANPISLSEYYAGAGYTPSGTVGQNGAIPSTTATPISAYIMQGATADPLASLTYLYTITIAGAAATVTPFNSSVTAVKIELWGGGGGGAVELGGINATGGGSGGYCSKTYTGVTTSTSYPVTAGFSAILNGTTNRNGLTGNTTSIPILGLYAYGGQGGSVDGSAAGGGTSAGGTTNTYGNGCLPFSSIGKGAPYAGIDSSTWGNGYGGGGGAYRGTLTYYYYWGGVGAVKFNAYGNPGFNNIYAISGGGDSGPGGVSGYTSGGSDYVSFTLTSSGTTSTSGTNQLSNYYYPTTIGIGNGWWVRFNYISGYSGTLNTSNFGTWNGQWRALSATVTYTLGIVTAKLSSAIRSVTGTFSFSNDGGASVYYTTGSMSFSVIVEDGYV